MLQKSSPLLSGLMRILIISKGVEKRIKELYPQLNLLFLDFDSNTSEVNIYNRCRIFPTFV